jgi:molecular chaperone DnaK (HSP70)
MSRVLGIDLGTTQSVVAVMEGGQPVVIRASSALGAEDVERMAEEARSRATEGG